MKGSGLLGFVILVADIYAVLQIAQSTAGNGKKALWIAIVIVLPVVGLVLWYLLGPGRSR